VATDQTMLELTTDATSVAGGWKLYQQASGGGPRGQFKGSSGACYAVPAYPKKTNQDIIYHATMDRRLSSNCVDFYLDGRNDNSIAQVDANTNDGSGFANSNLYIGGRGSTNDNIHQGLIKAFGIIDFTSGSTPMPLEHAALYADIRDWATV